eukprot:scaffold4412_cov91-Cylindrotheca_fusiformis.AAC.4
MTIPESASASSDGSSIVNTPTNEPPEEVREDRASPSKEEEEEGHQGTIDAPIEQVMEDRASAPTSPLPQEGGVSENRDRGLAATEVESMEESVLKFRESIVTPSPKEEVGKTRDVSNNSTSGLATSNKTHGQTSTPRRASTAPPDHTPPRTNKAHGQTYTAPRAGANEAHGQSFTAPRTTRTRGYYTYEANEAHGQSFTAPRTTTTQVPGYSPYPWCFIGTEAELALPLSSRDIETMTTSKTMKKADGGQQTDTQRTTTSTLYCPKAHEIEACCRVCCCCFLICQCHCQFDSSPFLHRMIELLTDV